jgi:hypothetical protein
MLQLTAGFPFLQCPVPSTPSLTVEKAAPDTADAPLGRSIRRPTATQNAATVARRDEDRRLSMIDLLAGGLPGCTSPASELMRKLRG